MYANSGDSIIIRSHFDARYDPESYKQQQPPPLEPEIPTVVSENAIPENAVLSEHGLISLSKNGLRSKSWGSKFWEFWLSLSTAMNPATHGVDLVIFFFKQAFGSTGPCVHCRNSHSGFCNRPENQIELFLYTHYDEMDSYPNEHMLLLEQYHDRKKHGQTVKQYKQHSDNSLYEIHYGDNLLKWIYIIKNNVNTKLDKPFVDYTSIAHYYQCQHPTLWEELFWYWLYCQVINYPIDVSRKARSQSALLNQRCKDYVELVEQIKNILPVNSALTPLWAQAYFENPPTVETFDSRERLFVWLYQIQLACHAEEGTLEETGKYYESLRAMSCKDDTKTCN